MSRSELEPGASLRGGMLLPLDAALPPVPLEQTTINVEVLGPLAETNVTQRFRHHHHAPLDALYVFPLPEEAAISAFELEVGARLIRGELQPRAAAEAAYQDVARRGGAAALLSQTRPNLFSLELANLQPAELVEVRLRFFSQVPFDDGWFNLAIPTVVLPRYFPDTTPVRPQDGAVPLLPEGQPAHRLSLQVSLNLGRLAAVEAAGFVLDLVEQHGRTVATLRDPEAVPDRDMVLRYRPAGDSYAAAAFAYRQAGRPGAAMLMLTPRALPEPDELLPREVLFVLDRSGSMGGTSMAQARNALRACLRALNLGDSFNIFPFDDRVEQLAPTPLRFTQAAVDSADAFIAGIEARGGTEIAGAISAALAQPPDRSRLRVLVFLTDGAVANEDEVLRLLAGKIGAARIFAFGIGSAVNRMLLKRLAALGRGTAEYILPGEAIEPAVQRFQRRAAMPLMRDLQVSWGAATLVDWLPEPLPDLYAGQPLVLLARYHAPRPQQAEVVVQGETSQGRFSERLLLDLPVTTPDRQGVWAALPQLWAKARLALLEDHARLDPARAQALESEIRALAMEYGLLSSQTAFVALEEPSPAASGHRAALRVIVPVHLPAGTMRDAFEPAPGLLGGPPSASAHFAIAAPREAAHRQAGGSMARTFQKRLQEDSARAAHPAAAPLPSRPAPREPSPTERRDAALRLLARTQAVNGTWADDEPLTVLAALAFALAGHTARRGDFRPQLARTARWLAARPTLSAEAGQALHSLEGAPPDPAALRALALATIQAAGFSLAQLSSAQQLGGDADGAVLPVGTAPTPLSVSGLRLTAALAILVVG